MIIAYSLLSFMDDGTGFPLTFQIHGQHSLLTNGFSARRRAGLLNCDEGIVFNPPNNGPAVISDGSPDLVLSGRNTLSCIYLRGSRQSNNERRVWLRFETLEDRARVSAEVFSALALWAEHARTFIRAHGGTP